MQQQSTISQQQRCARCLDTAEQFGTRTATGEQVCYACWGALDKIAMHTADRYTLYLTYDGKAWSVTNWPGTFAITRVYVKDHLYDSRGRRVGPDRRDVWFSYAGVLWHGVNAGDSQVLHCHTIRHTPRALDIWQRYGLQREQQMQRQQAVAS